VFLVTTLLTWQAEDGRGLEGARVLFGHLGFRAQGRMVRPDFTASYRLFVAEDGTLERLSITSDTAERERHLTLNRAGDGYWLLDTGGGGGGSRVSLGGATDVDLAFSPMFNTFPIRRLGLHREAGEHTLPMVFVSLPELRVEAVEQTYRTVSVLDGPEGHAVIEFRWADFVAELVVDADGAVISYPGVASRVSADGVPSAAG
jgi:hypothetical protein